jgi:hypothetical protein
MTSPDLNNPEPRLSLSLLAVGRASRIAIINRRTRYRLRRMRDDYQV